MAKPPLLEISNLSVSFGGQERQQAVVKAVERLSLKINPHETLALVGESGSGKSVTAHAVLRLLPGSASLAADSRIVFQGRELLSLPEKEMQVIRGNRIGMIFQEPMTSLNPLHTIVKQIGESLRLHGEILGRQAVRERVVELLRMVGIEEAEKRLEAYPHQLSGGQRQRVMIAMALANRPELLIADEPTTALDVTVQVQVLSLLDDLKERLGMAILLITHDLGIVRRHADRVAVMTGGHLVECAGSAEIFSRPRHSYTKKLLAAEPAGNPPALLKGDRGLLEARGLKVWFPLKAGFWGRVRGYVKAVDGVDLKIRPGESLGLVGESGSGKSTLGFALLRLQEASGEIFFAGREIATLRGRDLRSLRRDLQVVFQDPFSSLSPRLSIERIVGEGPALHGLATGEKLRRQVIAALAEVGLDESCLNRYPHEFSGGQRQRIAIARALIMGPKLLVLDEPTSSLDRSVQAQVIDLLRKLQQKHGLAYLFISHDLKVVKALCHRIMVLHQGRVVESGAAADIIEKPAHPYTQQLMTAAFAGSAAG